MLIRISVLGWRAAHRIALIYGFTFAHKARIHRFAIGSVARESLRERPGRDHFSARGKARGSLDYQPRRCRDGRAPRGIILGLGRERADLRRISARLISVPGTDERRSAAMELLVELH